ncbi:MAG: S41 family peptidase [Gemmatimonadaceae bacterium]|nr:S41 family peptidase [Gloeobacterales cyanobacterium ES-bin-141]
MYRRASNVVVLWLAVLTLLGGCSTATGSSTSKELLTDVWTAVNRSYVDSSFNGQDWWDVRQQYLAKPVKTKEQLYEEIQQMLKTLDDPYTRFLDPRQYQALETTTTGELSGVGLQISLDPKSELPTVIAPIEGSPAFSSGIKALDTITAIDSKPTKGLAIDDVAERMRGRVGTRVVLTIQRDGRQFDVPLKRATIEINPVTSALRQEAGRRIGYIRLSQFNANATDQMSQAIQKLEKQNASGFILDLRNNPGGLLTAGVEIARLWLEPGQTVVFTVDRDGRKDEARAKRAPLTTQPLVVLVDEGTASASEILAGALKDNRRATLVGQKTFGKGLIQTIQRLDDGSGLAVSIAQYKTPSGQDIHKKGIRPDVAVALPKDFKLERLATPEDPQYLAAVQTLNQVVVSGRQGE